jgi:hypothetical protein
MEAQTDAPAESAETQAPPAWLRLLFPSAAVIVFFIVFGAFVLYAPSRLLADPDAGWHIRNGQFVLETKSIPRVDHFSWSMPGKPWFAWEWLYDAIAGALTNLGGLTLFTIFNAALIALTFAAFLRAMMRRSGDFVSAFTMWVLAAAAGSIHFLGRPHLVTMLFLYVLLEMIAAFERGNMKWLVYGTPPLFILWANMHGGFVAAIVVLAIVTIGTWWDRRPKAGKLAAITLISVAVTLINPYGWNLHAHVFGYLGSGYLMRTIEEFAAPSFRGFQTISFGILIVIAIAVLAKVRTRNTTDLLLVLFAIAIGLRAVRNIPLACIVIGFVLAPYTREFWDSVAEGSTRGSAVARRIREFSTSTAAMDMKFSGVALAAIGVVIAIVLGIAAERGFANPIPKQQWDESTLPVKAADYLVEHKVQDKVFSSDHWGAYLIWRFYPGKVFVDDRHDYYGEAFVREMLQVTELQPGWRNILDTHGIERVLVPVKSTVATELTADGWREIYRDSTSVIVQRPAEAKQR